MENPSLGARVAAELRAERGRQRMNIAELAAKSGVGERTMQRYLLGTRELNVQTLDSICRALGVTVSTVIDRATRPGAASGARSHRTG